MLRSEYKERLEQIKPSPTLTAMVIEKSRKKRKLRPVLAFALVAVMILPVMAVQIPAVRGWLQDLGSVFTDRFLPVHLSDTRNGITVEVCGLMNEDEQSILPGSGVLILAEYADGRPMEEYPYFENIYFDGATTWEIGEQLTFCLTDREDKIWWVGISNSGVSLEELYGTTTTVLIDSMTIGDVVVEGPWRISFQLSEDLILTE